MMVIIYITQEVSVLCLLAIVVAKKFSFLEIYIYDTI